MVLDDKTSIFGDAGAFQMYEKLVIDELVLSPKPISYKKALKGLGKFHEWYIKN